MDSAVARPRPWLFGIASIPYGGFNGIVAVALPYLLRRQGISVDRIASIGAFVAAPSIWYFLWAPVVDVGFRRRTWIVLLSVASGICAAFALAQDSSVSTRALTTLLIAGSVFSQPVSSAIGGLVAAVVPSRFRGRTGGWSQAGILGGGVLAGGASVWASAHLERYGTAALAGALIALPAFAALAVNEPRTARPPLRQHLANMWRDLAAMLRRREVWLGILFFVSPIGAGALMNLFSALASDFHASSGAVIWAVAIAGIATPIGAILGGKLCDRFDRWMMYPVAGFVQATAVIAIRFSPATPATYIIGAASYALATGFAYAAFMALAFDLLGAGVSASGTQFTLFMAAANLPIVYMLRLDGYAHDLLGVHGMLLVDAGSNVIVGILFLAVLLL